LRGKYFEKKIRVGLYNWKEKKEISYLLVCCSYS